ncbi:MAG TPA: ECF-type sigma factor [Gemmatirosa sp.]
MPGANNSSAMDEVAGWLAAARGGDSAAWNALYGRLYDELHRLAHRVRAGRAGETLSTTALVHEAYLRLRPAATLDWEGRAHFFAIAARAMREVLVTAARRRATSKRGGGMAAVTFGDEVAAQPARPEALLALDEALDRLAAFDARRARVVEYRFFAGLSAAETAAVLGVSVPTVERDWRVARAWLVQALGEPVREPDPGTAG